MGRLRGGRLRGGLNNSKMPLVRSFLFKVKKNADAPELDPERVAWQLRIGSERLSPRRGEQWAAYCCSSGLVLSSDVFSTPNHEFVPCRLASINHFGGERVKWLSPRSPKPNTTMLRSPTYCLSRSSRRYSASPRRPPTPPRVMLALVPSACP